jgi:uncharacterized protein (DUF2147 family)
MRNEFRMRHRRFGSMSSPVAVVLCILMAAVGLGQAAAQEGQAPVGVWLTEEGESQIEIFRCGEALCGRIEWLEEPRDEAGKLRADVNNPDPSLRSRPILGLVIMTDIIPTEAPGRWEGRVYNPEDGRTYDLTLTLVSESEFIVEGCVLYGLICQSQRWLRVR